ncbi:chaperonin 10-like protein [Aspergillus californicus]
MRAARFHAAGDVRIEDIPSPQASDNEDKVLIEVEWCGICGSDLNYSKLSCIGPFAIPNPRRGPHPLTKDILPVTMGHEFTGRIVHVPESLPETSTGQPLQIGQAVVIDPRYYCSSCNPCTLSATNCCETIGFVGLSGGGGGLSEVVAVNPSQVYVIPEPPSTGTEGEEGEERERVDLAAAALIEPLAVAWHAVKMSRATTLSAQIGSDSSEEKKDLSNIPILIVGAGPVGVAMAFVLKAWGTQQILVSEPSKARREMLEETGIVTDILDPTTTDVAKRVKEVTGHGVGVVFDCAGSQPGLVAGCDSLRFRGSYINLAVPKSPINLPLMPFMRKEIAYKCSLAYDQGDFRETVDAFVAGRFKGVERMITRRVVLEDIVEQGFKELIKPNDHIKILATPKKRNVAPI